MESNKFPIFTIIVLSILLTTSLSQRSTINQLDNTLHNQNHQISTIQHSVQSVHTSVENSLANWERENRWLNSSRTVIKDIIEEEEQIEIDVSWQFNELKKDETVYLMVGRKIDASEYEWERISMDSAEELYFQKTLLLPLKEDYKLNAIAENNEERRLAELGKIEFYRELRERFNVHGDVRVMSGFEGAVSIDIYQDNFQRMYQRQLSSEFVEKLEMKSAQVEVYLDQQLIRTFDLLEGQEEHQEYIHRHDGYPETFIHFHKVLEIDGLPSKMSAIVKISDGMGETYEFTFHHNDHGAR